MAAQNEARKLVAGKKHLGVKVSQESYDEAEQQFKEKTLYKHLKSDSKPAAEPAVAKTAAIDQLDEFDEFDEFDDYDDEPDWVAPIFGLFAAIAIFLALGIFYFDNKVLIGETSKSGYFIYELPPVVANIASGGDMVSVRIDLRLELNGSEDTKAVEFAMAQIMESVVTEIQETDVGDLQRSEKIQLLRAQLKQKIQDAMGETNLNGVLFKNIKVF